MTLRTITAVGCGIFKEWMARRKNEIAKMYSLWAFIGENA